MAVVNFRESVRGAQAGAIGKTGSLVQTDVGLLDTARAPGLLVTPGSDDSHYDTPTSVAEIKAAWGVLALNATIELNDSGLYAVTERVTILRKGYIWMTVEVGDTGCAKGGQVFARYATGTGNPSGTGTVRSAEVTDENYPLPGAVFASTEATPGALVLVEFNLPCFSSQVAAVT